jgi:molecular chaperone DnaK (HSP70)
VESAVKLAELEMIDLVSEPEAVAYYYSEKQEFQGGEHLIVLNMRRGTFDATVLT